MKTPLISKTDSPEKLGHTPPIFAQYDEVFKTMYEETKLRRGLIFKRMVFVFWPLFFASLIFAISAAFMSSSEGEKILAPFFEGLAPPLPIAILIWFIFTAIYTIIFASIFSIEQMIWLDSVFDGHSLSPSQSWRVAKKIALPFILSQCVIILLYIVLPIVLGLSIVAASTYIWGLYGLLAMIPVVIALYISFLWGGLVRFAIAGFLFLDMYGPDFTIGRYLSELRKCSAVSRGEALTSILTIDFDVISIEVVMDIVRLSVIRITKDIDPKLIPVASFAGNVLNFIFEIYLSFAKLAGYHLVYKALRKAINKEEQKMNPYIYSLAS